MAPSAADMTRLVQAAMVPAVFTCGLSMLFLYIANSADPMNRFAIPTVSGDSVTAQVRLPPHTPICLLQGCPAAAALPQREERDWLRVCDRS